MSCVALFSVPGASYLSQATLPEQLANQPYDELQVTQASMTACLLGALAGHHGTCCFHTRLHDLWP